MDDPRGATVFVCGPPASGKSALLWHQYAKRAPRLITVEVVDETRKLDPDARVAYGFDATAGELAECAELTRWHLVAFLDRDEISQLFRVLAPLPRSASVVSFARAVGGVAVQCGELAHMAGGTLGKNSPVKDAYLRYRHHWLSIFGGTQHAPDCDPCTRMSAERCVFLRTSDDLGLQAVARASSAALAERVRDLPPYHSLTAIKSLGRAYVADARYKVYEVLDYRGASLSGARDESARSRAVVESAGGGVVGAAVAKRHQRRA